MALLKGKRALIVGERHATLTSLAAALQTRQVKVTSAECLPATLEEVIAQKIDFIILNALSGEISCATFLKQLSDARLSKSLPVFALVERNEAAINSALMAGAADYFTSNESVDDMMVKVRRLFGQPDTFSGSNIFDLPEDTINVNAVGKRVFIFEDDPLLRTLLATKLDTVSFPYEFSDTGNGAVKKIKAFEPHVIILDLMLPGKSGLEVLSEIKKTPEVAKTPVIIFSNRDSEEEKAQVFALGADRFFVKAMTDLSQLIETIEDLA